MHKKFQSDGLRDRLLRNRKVGGVTILKCTLKEESSRKEVENKGHITSYSSEGS